MRVDPFAMTATALFALVAIAALLCVAGYAIIRLNRHQRAKILQQGELRVAAPTQRRRPEDLATVLLAAAATGWLLLDLGGLAVPILAFVAIGVLQIPGQRAHNAARTAAIADYRRVRHELTSDERRSRLEGIRLAYGRSHPAVQRLAADEQLSSTP